MGYDIQIIVRVFLSMTIYFVVANSADPDDTCHTVDHLLLSLPYLGLILIVLSK